MTAPRTARPPERHSLLVLAAAVAVVACPTLAACSPEGGVELGQATSDERIDPCALLSVEDIDQTLGWQIPAGERPREHESDGQAVCAWEDHRSGLVQVQLYEGDGTERFEQARAELEAMGEATDATVVGAGAAWEDQSHGTVGMLVGEHFVQVTAWGEELTEGEHLELAEAVVGKL